MGALVAPRTLRGASLQRPLGLSWVLWAVVAMGYAAVGAQLRATAGEPLATALAHQRRREAEAALGLAYERRQLLPLQAALTDCAELAERDERFKASLTADRLNLARELLARIGSVTEELDVAAEVAATDRPSPAIAAFVGALERGTALFGPEPPVTPGDGAPLLGVAKLRAAADILLSLIERTSNESVREAARRASARAKDAAARAEAALTPEMDPPDVKLPPWYMPSFGPCVAGVALVICHMLVHLCAHWSSWFRCLLYFHPTSQLKVGSFVLVSPFQHRGKPEIVPVTADDGGRLFIVFQRQKYECFDAATLVHLQSDKLGECDADVQRGLKNGACGAIIPVQCPLAEPLGKYASSRGLSVAAATVAERLYGKNEFAIPLPSFRDLYVEQLMSPIAVFQIVCSFLWMLDDYWKYTLFTLLMICSFEATTAFQRRQNMLTLKGMGARKQQVLAFRGGAWAEMDTDCLLPGDVISMCSNAKVATGSDTGASSEDCAVGISVPADLLLLRGRAVTNEACLTGESVPQTKDALVISPKDVGTHLDIRKEHRAAILFSGTELIQHGSTDTGAGNGEDRSACRDADDAIHICPEIPPPPDGGCICYVLATAFSSSQGELMRLIEFSMDQVSSDKLETLGLLLLLLAFALAAASYVFTQGVAEGKKSKYELVHERDLPNAAEDHCASLAMLYLRASPQHPTLPLSYYAALARWPRLSPCRHPVSQALKCALIITSVVPPELPMQTALAVNTALMALHKAQVFCTEPFRVPMAGKITHTLFDKTGTITSDELTAQGLVNADDEAIPGTAVADGEGTDAAHTELSKSASTSRRSGDAPARALAPMPTASQAILTVIGGCHSLANVGGRITGDPIEIAALRGVGWRFDSGVAKWHDMVPGAEAIVRAAEARLSHTAVLASSTVHINAQHARSSGAAASVSQRGTQATAGSSSSVASVAAESRAAQYALDAAKARLIRAKERRDAKARQQGQGGMPLLSLEVRPIARHHFSSALQRMSTVAVVRNYKSVSGSIGSAVLCLVKGSPEAVGRLLLKGDGGKPPWYEATYEALARSGARVLALAYREVSGASVDDASNLARKPREWVETDLRFAGLLAFGCAIRSDSSAVIYALRRSGHLVTMLTGDAPFTALHVARSVGISSPSGQALLLTRRCEDGDFYWKPVPAGAVMGEEMGTIPFSVVGVGELRKKGFELLVMGDTWSELTAAKEDAWKMAGLVSVFARMSPEGKEQVVRALNSHGARTLMCGDGGNDVGALKAAHVGISLLSGFGSANVSIPSPTTDAPSPASSAAGFSEIAPASRSSDYQKHLAAFHAEYKDKEDEVKRKLGPYTQEERAARVARGHTGYMTLVIGSAWCAFSRMQSELVAERQRLAQKHGVSPSGRVPSSFGDSSNRGFQDVALSRVLYEESDGGSMPMVRVGDASVAAPFTSKLPSIRSACDVIRQGHCALVSTVQQQQILILHCLISAYSLSVLSLEGSRSSETQLLASGVLLSIASIAFSFARPVDTLSDVLPLPSIFHPALFLSVLGQLAIHASCMLGAVSMAKRAMGEAAILEAVASARLADKLYEAGEEEAAASAQRPNLLNTLVFLVETAQQVAVMLVNYKGRPWMKGATENPALLYSLVALAFGVTAATLEIVPPLNEALGLVPLPTEAERLSLLGLLAATLLGTLLWDRLCVAIFAPKIFRCQLDELASLSLSDFWGPNALRNLGIALGFIFWLFFLDGNVLLLFPAYFIYRKMGA